MNLIRTFILSLTLLATGTTYSQLTLAKKVYKSGSERHFNTSKKCEFNFQCDCCMGKLLFTSSTNYMLINYCMSDFVITKGNYIVTDNSVTLNSDGTRISKEYNWAREMNPDAQPAFFIKDSTITAYQLKYAIDICERTMLINAQEKGTFIASETELKLDDELAELRKYGLQKYLKFN